MGRMRNRAVCLALALWVAALPPTLAQEQRDHNEIVRVPQEDPDMREAIAKAQASLDDFLKVWKQRPVNTSNFKLKVKITEGDATEHFWVQPFREDGRGFAGRLANEPKLVHNVKNGQMVRFSREEITDWGYVKEGHQIGSFTVCALFKIAPKEQVEYYRKNFGFDC